LMQVCTAIRSAFTSNLASNYQPRESPDETG
jgi:hypothetical protein